MRKFDFHFTSFCQNLTLIAGAVLHTHHHNNNTMPHLPFQPRPCIQTSTTPDSLYSKVGITVSKRITPTTLPERYPVRRLHMHRHHLILCTRLARLPHTGNTTRLSRVSRGTVSVQVIRLLILRRIWDRPHRKTMVGITEAGGESGMDRADIPVEPCKTSRVLYFIGIFVSHCHV